jgi:hypothetical protein
MNGLQHKQHTGGPAHHSGCGEGGSNPVKVNQTAFLCVFGPLRLPVRLSLAAADAFLLMREGPEFCRALFG